MATGLGDEQLWLCPSLDNATPFNDLSSQGNNGTAQGGLSTVADTGSGGAYAYDLDGTDDYIDAPTSVVEGLSTGAISMWFKADSSASGTRRFLMSAGSGAAGQDATYFDIGPSTSGFTDESLGAAVLNSSQGVILGGFYRNGESFFFDNSWHHVVYMSDSTGNSMYIDGVLVSLSYTGGSSASTQALFRTGLTRFYIGVRDWNGLGGFFSGHQDDIRVYDRALTQSEITHLATARGIEGRPFDGLGDEQLWLCPSLENSPNDLSGNNNNGAYNGGMGTIADTSNGGSLAYDLNGTTQYITLGSVLTGTGDFTISGWFNTDSTSYSYIYGKDVSSPTSDGIGIAQQANTVYGAIGDSSGRAVLAAAGTTAISTWYHYAVTFDRDGVATKYLNGVQIGTDSISSRSGDIGTDTDYVGRFGNVSGGFFDGKLDDIRAYNRVLTQAEISWLATERGVLGTPPEGLGDEQLWLCPSIQDSANDLSGNGNDGTYNGGMGTVADTSNGGSLAYDFDGTNDYINCGTASSPTDLTMSVWVNVLSSPASTAGVVGNAQSGGVNGEYLIWTQGSNARALIYTNGTGGTATLPSNTWVHLVATRDTAAGFVYLYLDGVVTQQVAITSTHPTLTRDFIVGSFQNGFYFSGLMDDIRFYNRALTQSEISWLATERGVLGTPPEGLGDEQLWLCPSIQDSANDLSGNNNNGAYQGSMGTVADTGSGGSLAYDFDGTNDYIDITGYANSKTAYSLSTWINGTGPNQTVVAFNVGDSSGSRSLNLGLQPSAIALAGHQVSPSSYWAESTSTVNGAGWKHVAATYDGSDIKIYVDGVLEDTQAAPNSTTAQTRAFIGRWVGSTPFWLTGKMDDIRAYDRALTQAEITHLASQRGVLGSPSTTTQYNAFVTHAFRQLFQTRLR